MAEQNNSSISWGGLVKGLVAGAAVAAGLYLVATGNVTGLLEGVKNLGLSAGAAFSGEATKVTVSEGSKEIMGAIGAAIVRVVGAIAAWKGFSVLVGDNNSPGNAEEQGSRYREAKESFAMREDMRKMQAVMVARMQANGYQPAMAMANAAPGR